MTAELLRKLDEILERMANLDVSLNIRILKLLKTQENQPYWAGIAAGLAHEIADLGKIRSMVVEAVNIAEKEMTSEESEASKASEEGE